MSLKQIMFVKVIQWFIPGVTLAKSGTLVKFQWNSKIIIIYKITKKSIDTLYLIK